MGGRLFTDKLVFWWLEGLGVWSLDSATPFPSAYPAHASGLPGLDLSCRPNRSKVASAKTGPEKHKEWSMLFLRLRDATWRILEHLMLDEVSSICDKHLSLVIT